MHIYCDQYITLMYKISVYMTFVYMNFKYIVFVFINIEWITFVKTLSIYFTYYIYILHICTQLNSTHDIVLYTVIDFLHVHIFSYSFLRWTFLCPNGTIFNQVKIY